MKCVLFLPVVLAFAADAAESPVQKVVTMLKAMSKKGKVELQDEKVQYAKYAQWCASTKSEKSSAIDEASGKVDVLKADISKAQTDAEVLAKEIEEHNAQIEKITAEQTKAKEVREKEAEDYAVELKDYKESVDAIGKALDTMEKQAGSRPQALMQLATGGRHAQEVKALAELALTKPEAAAYDFQSGNINSMLKKLQDQFVTELRELEKAEMSKKNSYSLLAESLTNQKSTETEDMERKVGVKAKKLELAASKQDELTTTSSSKDADTKYLDDVSATCSQKAADYESNQKLRTDELEAISKAVQIVSQKLSLLEVKFQSLLQMKRKATSLALLRSTKNDDKLKAKLLGFLQGEAQRLKSAALMNLLEPVATAALGKVKETIEGVIHKLEEQDSQDTEKQTWCASELKSNEKSRREKAVMVDELNADIDLLNASIISLGEEIVTMQRELSDSAQAIANATEIRKQEQSMNAATIEEAQKAQAAVLEAINVLKEFYESSGLGASLLQEKSGSKQPAMTGAYGGMTDESGGVVSLLETISADFSRLEADTKAEESSAAGEFDKLSKDYRLNKAEKETDLKHLQSSKVEKTSQLATKGSELQTGEKELAGAQQYYEELKAPCVKGGAAWKEREEQRKEELESLKKAMKIMSTASA